MLKIILSAFILFITFSSACASGNPNFSGIISSSNINKSGVSLTIINLDTGKEVYKLHSKQLFSPASVQKLVTCKAAEDTLGKDYLFKTSLYKNTQNEYLIKLGADPLLETGDLKELVTNIQPAAKSIYIDDSIVDNVDWGEGWQWDDDLNPLMPKFSAYNLDGNLITLFFVPTTPGAPAVINQERFYPLSFVNEVVTGGRNNVILDRRNYIAPDMIIAAGTVKTLTSKKIPINNTRRYFKLTLERILSEAKIDYSGVYRSKKLTPDFKEIASVSHSIKEVQREILTQSSNLAAESLFKTAASKISQDGTGTFAEGLKMFENYCKKNNIDCSEIKLADASGVSKNNLLTGEFIAFYLAHPANKDLKEHLPTAGEGTLAGRMSYMAGKLHAKTGTLSNISSIAGYIDTKNGSTYAFCIMINDPKSKIADKKMLEEYLIREIYIKL